MARVLREGVLEPDSPEPERRSRLPIRGDPAKIKVVYGGIDTGRFRPGDASTLRSRWGLEPGHYAFAVVGCYDRPRGKGQREFLQAAARVQERVPRARFLIVGRGNLRETLETDIRQLGLGGKAWLTPYCDDMPAAMNAIDCLVHPQVGTEAFGLVVCEAHACGKPVVASALDGLPEAFAVGGHGQLLPPESVEALAQALAHWAGVPPLAAEEREALHARVHARFASARLAAGRGASLPGSGPRRLSRPADRIRIQPLSRERSRRARDEFRRGTRSDSRVARPGRPREDRRRSSAAEGSSERDGSEARQKVRKTRELLD